MKSQEGMMAAYHVLGDLALQETRTITTFHPRGNLPPGNYALIELYCADRKCDCRRVLLQVRSQDAPGEVLATINFGWESVEFYTRWMHGDRESGEQIASGSLDLPHLQSPYCDALFDLVQETALKDPDYVERLARHYKLFKKAITRKRRLPG